MLKTNENKINKQIKKRPILVNKKLKVKKGRKVHPLNYRVKAPIDVITIPNQSYPYKDTVVVKPQWNPLVLQEMQAALTSFMLTRGILGTKASVLDIQKFYNGMLYQWVGFAQDIAGTPNLSFRLSIIHDLISAFQQKSVNKFTFQKVSYGWTDIDLPNSGAYKTGWNTWDFVIPGPDDSTYNSPALAYNPTPSQQDYSDYLAQVKSISAIVAQQLEVKSMDDTSPLTRDVSAFAKVYPYVGLNSSGSGAYYNDIENEVGITAPIIAHNVVYPKTQDDRVPFKLTVNQGGPASNLAPLLPQFDSWFNKCPINYKFIDFFEIVNMLLYWYIQGVKMLTQSVDFAHKPLSSFTLPFTFQDFTVVVRQALLVNFKDQWVGQFVGPLQYDNSATNFLPFQILGNCYGNDAFRNFLSPTLLAENLSMLQSVKVSQPRRKSKINTVVYVPILGFYNDVQIDWSLESSTGSKINLFEILPQKALNLVDCTLNGTDYINVNASYYQNAFANWNNSVNALRTVLNVTDLANLAPPRSSAFIRTTRVIAYNDFQNVELAGRLLNFPCLGPINNRYTRLVKQDSKKTLKDLVTLPPPTTLTRLVIDDIYSQTPLMKEVHEFMTYLILPSIRLDPTSSNDVLNKVMYQTITGEGLSQSQDGLSNAPQYLQRLFDAANMCVDGQGKITSSTISILMETLTKQGNGGFLASLLSGVAKNLLPGASGLIDSIASVVPF